MVMGHSGQVPQRRADAGTTAISRSVSNSADRADFADSSDAAREMRSSCDPGAHRPDMSPNGRQLRRGRLSEEARRCILSSLEPHSTLARRYGVTEGAVRYVRREAGVDTLKLALGNHEPLVALADPEAAQIYVVERSTLCPLSGCWLWDGPKDSRGYGQGHAGGQVVQAHRLSRLAFFGRFDHRLVVRHACNQRACVNPSHLELGTQAENIADAVKLGRHPHGVTHGRYCGPGALLTPGAAR